jgi:hypothetical protein
LVVLQALNSGPHTCRASPFCIGCFWARVSLPEPQSSYLCFPT